MKMESKDECMLLGRASIQAIVLLIVALGIDWSRSLYAQVSPDFLPEDLELYADDFNCICQPGVINKSRGKGVLLEYKLNSGGSYTPDAENNSIFSTEVRSQQLWKFRIKIPLLNQPRTKMLLGFDHFAEKFSFRSVRPQDEAKISLVQGHTLKSTRATLYLLQSLGEVNYLGVRARVSYNGNYSGLVALDPRFRIYKITGIFGIKKREDIEWGIGLFFSKSFKRNALLPFLLYNRTYNEHWGIEAALPVSFFFRYNFNPHSLMLMGMQYAGSSYALKNDVLALPPSEDFFFKHSEIQFLMNFERQLQNWIWASLQFGWQINFDSEFLKASDFNDDFRPDLADGVFLRMGVFLSPPDNRR